MTQVAAVPNAALRPGDMLARSIGYGPGAMDAFNASQSLTLSQLGDYGPTGIGMDSLLVSRSRPGARGKNTRTQHGDLYSLTQTIESLRDEVRRRKVKDILTKSSTTGGRQHELAAVLIEYEERLADQQHRIDQLCADNEALANDADNMLDKLKYKEERRPAGDEVEKLKAYNSLLHEEKQLLIDEKTTFIDETAHWKKKAENTAKRNKDLMRELEETKRLLKDTQSACSKMSKQIQKLQNVPDELESTTKIVDIYKDALTDAKGKVFQVKEAGERKVKALSEERKRIAGRCRDAEQQVKDKEVRLGLYEAEVSVLQRKLQNLKMREKNYKERCATSEHLVAEMQRMVEACKKKQKKAQTERDLVIDRSKYVHETLVDERSRHAKELNRIVRALQERQAEIEQLKGRGSPQQKEQTVHTKRPLSNQFSRTHSSTHAERERYAEQLSMRAMRVSSAAFDAVV